MKKTRIVCLILAVVMAMSMFVGCNKKEQVKIEKVEDLAGLTIGVQEGTSGDVFVTDNYTKEGLKKQAEEAEKEGKEPVVVPGDDFKDATINRFKKPTDAALELKNGKSDCVVLDKVPATKIVEKNSDLKILDLNLTEEEYAIATPKGSAEMTESINATLKKLKEDGTYDKMVAYFIDGDTSVELPEIPEYTASGKIVMGTNAEFEPFEYRADNNEITGFDVYLSKWIAADMGKELTVEDMAFDSLIGALQTGKVDFIAAGMTADAERRKNVDFSDPYYNASQVIIVRK